ncbi:cupin domain-containing protein [Pseudomonas schmalbachii]|uniref:Cupin domain-containing protein n=1 Tax=Pseudomonas schmalbachii TaxID=2816993 RepID=A0ABS3TWD3_9PSED|nr:cupin domain-containing protein [Pseudomonas schmalbachii]MBO3277989.1 cupin domain-containing protein [Pseudomonas schmalbachii]
MTAQRIITGHDDRGLSQIVSAGPIPGNEEFTHSPGFSAALVWQTSAEPVLADVESQRPLRSVLPGVGGTSAMLVTFPPQDQPLPADFDPAAAAAEICARLPGLGELFEADNPGFHRTDTIDYGVVLEGELCLELDEGRSTHLRRGDVVVQMGTRHAWRNTGNTPARMLFVMVGASRG